MRPITPPAEYVFAALSWVWEDGEWSRYLVRVSRSTQEVRCDELTWVDTDYPCCLACLSQYVEIVDGIEGYVRCLECDTLSEYEAFSPPFFG